MMVVASLGKRGVAARVRRIFDRGMRLRVWPARLAVVTAALLAIALSTARSDAVTPAQLTMTSPAPMAVLGLDFKVNLNIANVTQLTAWGTDVNTDASKLTFGSVAFTNTFIQSTARTAICLGPNNFYIPAGSQTTTPTAPAATTVDVSNVGPFTIGKPAILNWTYQPPSDAGGAALDTGGTPLVTGGGSPVTYPNTTTLVDTTAQFLVSYAGKVVRSGSNYATILSNTTTTLTLSPGWSPATPSAGASYQVVPAITSTATTLTDPSKAWSTNWAGKVLRSGIEFATITSNTATALTFAAGWFSGNPPVAAAAPTPGSPYTIVDAIAYTPSPGPYTLTDPSKSWSTDQWKGAFVSSGANFATVASNTATVVTLTGAWSPATPVKGDAYVFDFGPPVGVTETVSVTGKNPNSTAAFPGTLTVTRGTQLFGLAPVTGLGTYTPSSVADLTQAWIPNEFVGATVVSGSNTGTVQSNTPTTLTLTSTWSPGTPAANAQYTVKQVFPATTTSLKVADPARTGISCFTLYTGSPPTPNGPTGGGQLATITLKPQAVTSGMTTTTISWGPTTQVTGSAGAHPFTTTNLSVRVIPCPIADGLKKIDVGEFSALLNAWNAHGPPNASAKWNPLADFDGSNKVDSTDFQVLLAYWNKTCP